MSIVIITGTGTDIGKTIATAAVAVTLSARGRRVVVVKPAQTGFPGTGGDLDDIARLTGVTDLHGFVRYPEPMAPLAAARRAGLPTLGLDEAAARIREFDGPDRTVLVEGAGGLLVRLGSDAGGDGGAGGAGEWGLPDLSARLPGAKTAVVTPLGLGSLNTAELTVEVAEGRGMDVIGLIGGSLPARHAAGETDPIVATNLDDLPHLTGVDVLGAVPEGAGAMERERFVAAAPGWFSESGMRAFVG
ncbi:dethiobiotin synthase [Corynebacterium xerosis]|uniref:ATP-dependent dethiobiotin synthetase BioD n=1 Tax=Corynebacterium xerosis TaxID=1725 RepID=UPI000EAEF28D|nr:ATP-dependent dethiobiotin synthetase BioD [Corynebacterium xerosis]AYJ32273.1 dethiobiotin synthase [Corynebacterium xerosis]